MIISFMAKSVSRNLDIVREVDSRVSVLHSALQSDLIQFHSVRYFLGRLFWPSMNSRGDADRESRIATLMLL